MPLTHRAVSVLASTAVLITGFVGAVPKLLPRSTPPAHAADATPALQADAAPALPVIAPEAPAALTAQPASNVDGAAPCSNAGPLLRYLVVFDTGTDEDTADAQIGAACGDLTTYYAPIAVAVATSPDHHFADRMGRDRAYSAEGEGVDGQGRIVQRKPNSMDAVPSTGQVASTEPDRGARQWDMAMIHADAAHQVTLGSSNVVVGVLDSGIDASHPDLRHAVDAALSAGCTTGKADQEPAAWAPTTSAHGTHVAGTIAAAGDPHGITGVAPGVTLASVKVVDDSGYIYPEYAICGFMWAAAHHFTVTNNSYFVDPWQFTCQHVPGQRVVHEAVRRAVAYATRQGVLSVAAAGNEGLDLADPQSDSSSPDNAATPRTRHLDDSCDMLPGQLKGVVAVSSVGAQGVKAGYSSYGLGVADVTAPGGDRAQPVPAGSGGEPGPCVLSTVPGGGYGYSCGTSMAVPHVAGVAALLASTHPGAGPAQLTKLLNQQANPIPCPGNYDLTGSGVQDAICDGYSAYNGFYGHGMVDALKAVRN